MIWDEARLRELLGGPATHWIRDRIRKNLERGQSPQGAIVLHSPTQEQQEYIDRMFGRVDRSGGGSLRIDVSRLTAVLVEARICDDLVEALIALDGPVRDRAGEARERENAWADLDAAIGAHIADRAWLTDWYRELRGSGLLTRLAEGDPARARRLLDDALRAADRWPERGVSLPELAATLVGDAHALDLGRPLGSLLVRAAAAFGDLEDWQTADGRRDCWGAVGVLCDELSAPVLTLGLGAAGDGLTDRVLRAHLEAGEACSLTLRQLVRHRPRLDHLAGTPVFVCENPAIVASAVDRLGARAAPLVCTAGFLRGATRLLLRTLVESGARLRVRADFDVEGLHIAGKTLCLPEAAPWRFDAVTYLSGTAGPKLPHAELPPTPWDPALGAAMTERRVAVHEEAVLPLLLDDLARPEQLACG